ncbi:MAG: PepSY domain-containing protein [Clostridia bacterium]|nr:PepSY domain-containing protein [Clostridia bacterium]
MKKAVAAALVLCTVFLSACSLFGGQLIGKDAALEIALKDAGVERTKAFDIDVELERERQNKWYEVEFDAGSLEYDYRIQAETGEILSQRAR